MRNEGGLMKTLPRPFVLCNFYVGGAPPLTLPLSPLYPLPQKYLRGREATLPRLGRDALRKLHGVEFSAKAVKQFMIANRTGDREAVDEANTKRREQRSFPPRN